ncbi:Hsp20/alpha crystallin family protein [Rubellicoccus peritrichatus]|uniref:Hsp20/alpha crystallin family protein n=1 Tax=Rubellicoccus peritrichatus TaxID=3080537 RepID=A0AAQ3L9F2_9BACT|nr:Hsp20/alpha crystallin family protein [Puniceicoccus sp. CR14]WOO41810.1 Hsp20/alpha crystallin family protein [Puniceicoccus sp. CR14]
MNCQIQKNDNQTTDQKTYRRPAYNVNESEGAYTVEVFVPGVTKSGVEISLEDTTLSVVAKRPSQETPEGWKTLRREIASGDYRLQLEVNAPVNREGIAAKVEDGVLNITLPKAEEAKTRKIDVN